jgi:hypothetical protein
MVERRSHVADSADPRRSGTGWFLNALFPNGKTAAIKGFAEGSGGSECPGLATVAAALSEPTKKVWRHVDGGGFAVQTCLAALELSIGLACGFASSASRLLTRLREKWENATTSPWFALLCASVSFAALLVLAGAFTGMALTKQPGRMGPRIGAITPCVQSQSIERKYDNDPIATLIELTSHPEATGAGPSSPTTNFPTQPNQSGEVLHP